MPSHFGKPDNLSLPTSPSDLADGFAHANHEGRGGPVAFADRGAFFGVGSVDSRGLGAVPFSSLRKTKDPKLLFDLS